MVAQQDAPPILKRNPSSALQRYPERKPVAKPVPKPVPVPEPEPTIELAASEISFTIEGMLESKVFNDWNGTPRRLKVLCIYDLSRKLNEKVYKIRWVNLGEGVESGTGFMKLDKDKGKIVVQLAGLYPKISDDGVRMKAEVWDWDWKSSDLPKSVDHVQAEDRL